MNEVLDAVERTFVGLPSPTMGVAGHGSHPCQGIYWHAERERPKAAFIATHYSVDYAEHYLAPYLAKRGFGFLGWNTRYRGAEDTFALEHALIDIGVGVRWLRKHQGIDTIIILGNSGGASLMGAYQANALSPSLSVDGRAGEALAGLMPGDAYISVNSHPGRPDVLTNWLDPSVTDETDPAQTDPELDMYNPDNGPPYREEFQTQYRNAQKARNERITLWAQGELKRLNKAGIMDRVFPLFRAWADLRFMDPALDPSDRPCPACYLGDPAIANKLPFGLGRTNTLRSWLSMWSLTASQTRAELQLPVIKEPALVVQGTADTGCFPSDAESIFNSLGSEDKHLEMIPGAHYFEGPNDHRDRVSDLLTDWVRSRF